MRSVADSRMSKSGLSFCSAASRGISHSVANDAKVDTLTRGRPPRPRMSRTARSSWSSICVTVWRSAEPAGVSSTWRVPRLNTAVPRSSSSDLICRLIALWVRCSSSAAALNDSRRATTSKRAQLVQPKRSL